MTESTPAVQGAAQDQGRARGERQDGQDDRRVRRAAHAPPAVQARHPPDDQVQGPRRGQRRPRRRHGPHRGVAPAVGDEALAARRGRAAGRRPRRPAELELVAEEAEVSEAIHAAAHPGRGRHDADAAEAGEDEAEDAAAAEDGAPRGRATPRVAEADEAVAVADADEAAAAAEPAKDDQQ